MATFVPRKVFPTLNSLPRSYFLGHHKAGLDKMKTMLSHIDLVIECRDYRIPLSSRNPLFEENLAGRERLIVYTKQDLGSEGYHLDREVSTYSTADLPDVVLTRCPISSESALSKISNVPPPFSSRTTKTNLRFEKSSSSHVNTPQQPTPSPEPV